MDTRKEIEYLLARWLKLTNDEGSAIQSAAWKKVQEAQAQKAALQHSLDTAQAKWAVENPGEASAPKPFRAEVGRLISLEGRNAELLAAQLRRARREQQDVDQAGRNLRKIQRSYTRGDNSGWQCYS